MEQEIEKIVDRANKDLGSLSSRFTRPYCLWLEQKLIEAEQELSKLHQPTVISAVCDNCKDVQGMYLGMTCPKCNRPFRDVKQTDL